MAEACRLDLLRGLEERLRLAGYERIAGVDEVGRGCLAGPVVAAAVVMPSRSAIPGVDSKHVEPKRRALLADRIRREAIACRVVAVEAATIDRVNILEATRRAMREALGGLRPAPDLALIDAVAPGETACPRLSLVRGDLLSYSIACASIVAKVERDRTMARLSEAYPQYGFADHKGYAAPVHLRALREYGPTPVHRLSFRSVLPRVARRVAG